MLATNGVAKEVDWDASGVSIDSRTVKPGDLFIALKGDVHDGHKFVQMAFEKGAVAAIVSEKDMDGNCVLVKDTFRALQKLAMAARARVNADVIGVTGSVGKTTVKSGIQHCIQALTGSVHYSEGNYNNHIGMPLSLARMPANTKYAVFEMGMSGAGEIAELTNIAKPTIAVITTVDAVHLEFFDSVRAIAHAKAEIWSGLTDGGTAIIPADNPYAELLEEEAEKAGAAHITTFGRSVGADVRLLSTKTEEDCQHIEAEVFDEEIEYTTQLMGKHHAINTLAILSAIHAAGLDAEEAAKHLNDVSAVKGRGTTETLRHPETNAEFVLVDDSYNASPISMVAALEQLRERATLSKGRAIAVLGDMLELGDAAPELHKEIADKCAALGIHKVYASGELMKHCFDVLPNAICGEWKEKPLSLLEPVLSDIKANDVLLLKGSNGSKVHELAKEIQKLSRKK